MASFGDSVLSSVRGVNFFRRLADAPAVAQSGDFSTLIVASEYPDIAKSGLPKRVAILFVFRGPCI